MTRKRFKKLCMGLGNMDRNKAQFICEEYGYKPETRYIFIFCMLFKPHLKIKSKKQAKYFGQQYLDSIDIKIIEKYVEFFKNSGIPYMEQKCNEEIKNILKKKFLDYGMWNYDLVAENISILLYGKQSIEDLYKRNAFINFGEEIKEVHLK